MTYYEEMKEQIDIVIAAIAAMDDIVARFEAETAHILSGEARPFVRHVMEHGHKRYNRLWLREDIANVSTLQRHIDENFKYFLILNHAKYYDEWKAKNNG